MLFASLQRLGLVFGLALAAAPVFAQTPVGTAFTYQGRLDQSGSPADGSFPMEFRLWDAPAGGSQVGPTLSFDGLGGHPAPVSVTSGRFSVPLDFAAGAFGASARWLEIRVNGVPLSPRTQIMPAPVSLFSAAPWSTNGNVISYTGSVGVGTSSPLAKLHVNGGNVSDGLLVESTNAFATRVMFRNVSGATAVYYTDITGPSNGYGANKMITFWNGVPETTLDNSGRFGIGTTSPTKRLEVHSPSDCEIGIQSDTGPGRLWTLQSSSGSAGGQLSGSFQIIDRSAPASRMMIDSGGNVGIGTTAPQARLHVAGGDIQIDTGRYLRFGGPTEDSDPVWITRARWGPDQTGLWINVGDNPGSADDDIHIDAAGIPQFIFRMNGDALKTGFPSWGVLSDARAKHDIQPLSGVLDSVLQLKGRTFFYNEPNQPGAHPGKCTGFIAQEVEPIFPDWVSTDRDGKKMMHISGFEALAVESLRELRQEKDAEITALRQEKDAQIRELAERLTRLEARLERAGGAAAASR